MDSTQNIISFCTGYGGLEMGLHRVIPNLRTVCYVEIEAFACANLVAKIEQGKMDAAPIWTDIATFDGEPFQGKVHGIIGGYPCQPFSNAGKRQGKKDPRHLWPYIEEHIRTIRPVWCFFENVGGHLTLGFKEVAQSLRDLGYKVEAGLFTASEVGAPHKRERLFILAYTESERPLREPGTVQQADGRQGGTLFRKPIGTSEKLGYTQKLGLERERPQGREQVEFDGTGEELANPNLQPDGQNAGGDGEADSIQEVSGQEVCRGGIAGTSEQLANCVCQGLQGCKYGSGADERGRQEQDGPVAQCRTAWPARPGQEQYDWEEPRTVKSGMGRTVDGFASRVDELRLLGNGVVPQTAELAFRTLWSKI